MKEHYINLSENELAELYDFIEQHALKKDLSNSFTALQLLGNLLNNSSIDRYSYQHCLMICRMLIDLNISLSIDEEDILLSSAICHILVEDNLFEDIEHTLITSYNLDKKVVDTILLLDSRIKTPDAQLQECFEKIQENKLALLIALTDQGNVIEQLYIMSAWQVRKFIYDTRRYYFSMCIYAKEHYFELLSPIGILMEKLRNLTDVSDTLVAKFESMEIELTQEIVSIKEENATIKGILKKYQNS